MIRTRLSCAVLPLLALVWGCGGGESEPHSSATPSTPPASTSSAPSVTASASSVAVASASASATPAPAAPAICNTAAACKSAAKSILGDFESHAKDAKARAFLERACALGEGEGCTILAQLTATRFFGDHGAADLAGATKIARDACDAKAEPQVCALAAKRLFDAGDADFATYAKRACEISEISPHSLFACSLATLGLKRDGLDALEKRCRDDKANDVVSCGVVLDALGPGSPTADAKRRTKLEHDIAPRALKGCLMPMAGQCAAIVAIVDDGVFVPNPQSFLTPEHDGAVAQVSDLYDNACDSGVPRGCLLRMRALRKEGKNDAAAGAGASACRDRAAPACGELARMGVAKQAAGMDLPAALYLAERACYLDDAECDAVADVIDAMVKAKMTVADPAEEAAALDRACKAGKKPACTRKPAAH